MAAYDVPQEIWTEILINTRQLEPADLWVFSKVAKHFHKLFNGLSVTSNPNIRFASLGSIALLEWDLSGPAPSPLTTQVMAAATRANHLETAKYLLSKGCNVDRTSYPVINAKNIVLIKFLVESKVPLDNMLGYHVANYGDIELIKWAVAHGVPADEQMLKGACSKGNEEVIRFVFSDLVKKWDKMSVSYLARNGRLDLLEWAVSGGAELKDPSLFNMALESGKVDLMDWLKAKGVPIRNDWVTIRAISDGRKDMLEWLLAQGQPLKLPSMIVSPFMPPLPSIDLLNFVKSHGIVMPTEFWWSVVEHKDEVLLDWLLVNNKATLKPSVTAWPIYRGCDSAYLDHLLAKGLPLSTEVAAAVASKGDLKWLKVLVNDRKVAVDKTVVMAAVKSTNKRAFNVVKYLIDELKQPITPELTQEAFAGTSMELLSYLRDHKAVVDEKTYQRAASKFSKDKFELLASMGYEFKPINVLEAVKWGYFEALKYLVLVKHVPIKLEVEIKSLSESKMMGPDKENILRWLKGLQAKGGVPQ